MRLTDLGPAGEAIRNADPETRASWLQICARIRQRERGKSRVWQKIFIVDSELKDDCLTRLNALSRLNLKSVCVGHIDDLREMSGRRVKGLGRPHIFLDRFLLTPPGRLDLGLQISQAREKGISVDVNVVPELRTPYQRMRFKLRSTWRVTIQLIGEFINCSEHAERSERYWEDAVACAEAIDYALKDILPEFFPGEKAIDREIAAKENWRIQWRRHVLHRERNSWLQVIWEKRRREEAERRARLGKETHHA